MDALTRRPRKRWLFRVVRAVVIALVLAVFAAWLLRNSFVTRIAATRALSGVVGAPVSAASVTLDRGGRLTLTDVVVRAPGLEGPAGEVASVSTLRVDLDVFSLLSGSPRVYSVLLDKPVLRISQSRDDGSVNLAALSQPAGGAKKPAVIPTVLVREGQVELGEHGGPAGAASYAVLDRFFVSGQVVQSADPAGGSTISFKQTGGAGEVFAGAPLIIDGRLDEKGLSLTLGAIDLASVHAERVPAQLRDLVREAQLEGRIAGAVLSYEFGGAWGSRINLEDVSINLPVETQPDEDEWGNVIPLKPADAGKMLRMRHTTGTLTVSPRGVSGDFRGVLAELPYEVTVETQGTSADAAWTCTLTTRAFRVRQHPEILKFAPGLVRRRLRDFSDPEGVLDAEVTIRRDAVTPESPSPPLAVTGALTLRDVTAAFHRFPYEFKKLKGRVTFDQQTIRIESLEGVADSGATIRASGVISPLTDEAGVDLDIVSERIPVDAALQRAMVRRGQDRTLAELFDAQRYAQLIDAGLVSSSRPRESLDAAYWPAPEDPPRRADAQLLAPPPGAAPPPHFELGGLLNAHVRVHRPKGPDMDWDDVVTIDLPRVGVLPRVFPYPLIAEGVRIVQQHDVATFEGGTFHDLFGGRAQVTGKSDQRRLSRPGVAFVPEVEVRAENIQVTNLLLSALPAPGVEQGVAPLGEMIAPLRPSGLLRASVSAGLTQDDTPRYDVRIDLDGVSCDPAGPDGSGRVALREVSGVIHVTRDSSSLKIVGEYGPAAGGPGDRSPLAVEIGGAADGVVSLFAAAPTLDLSLPVEDLLRGPAPQVHDSLARLRESVSPAGVADFRFDGALAAQGGWAGTVRVGKATGLAATLGGTICRASTVEGEVTIAFEGPHLRSIVARDVRAAIDAGDVTCRVEASGDVGRRAPGSAQTALQLKVSDARVESPLVQLLLRSAGATGIADFCTTSGVRGSFDAQVEFIGGQEVVWPPAVRGVVRPHDLSLTLEGVPVEFPTVSGSVALEAGAGRFDNLRFAAPLWDATISGFWSRTPGVIEFDGVLDLTADRLSPDLRVALPLPVREVLDALAAKIDGRIAMMGSEVSMSMNEDAATQAVRTSGIVAVEDAQLDLGIPVSGAVGLIDYAFERRAGERFGTLGLSCDLERARAANAALTDGHVQIESVGDGVVRVPAFRARMHGGRVTGDGAISPPGLDGAPRDFALAVEFSNVRFASLLNDLTTRRDADQTPPPIADDPAPDGSRGLLSGGFTLAGKLGDIASRRGRGTLDIRGGRVLDLPTLVPITRITNLQLPVQERLDYALADFYVLGPVFSFEQLQVSSKTVGLYGVGTMTMPAMALDLRLRAENRARFPVLTAMLEGLREELATTQVRGTLTRPDVQVVSFSAARRAWEGVFGQGLPEEERRFRAIERAVAPEQRRRRPGEEPAIPPITRVLE